MAIGNMISLGQRAGMLVSGDMAVKSTLIRGKARLLIIAKDAATRTRRELSGMAGSRNVPVISYGSKEELGRLIGKSPRSALALMDEHMVRGILGVLERGNVDRT